MMGGEGGTSGDGGLGLLVLIEPTPLTMLVALLLRHNTMLRHYYYGTIRAHSNATGASLKCWRSDNGLGRHMRQCSDRGGGMRQHTASPQYNPPTPHPSPRFSLQPPCLPTPPPIVIFIYPYKGSEAASLSPKQISTGSFHCTAASVQESYFIYNYFNFHQKEKMKMGACQA